MQTINFEIIYQPNPQIHQNGFVEAPDDIEELPNWFYYDQSGIAQPREFTHHDGVGISQIGATEEQTSEIDRFLYLIHFELVDFVNDTILLAFEDERTSFVKGDILIKINGGSETVYVR